MSPDETDIETIDEAHPEPVAVGGVRQDNVTDPGIERTHYLDGSISEHETNGHKAPAEVDDGDEIVDAEIVEEEPSAGTPPSDPPSPGTGTPPPDPFANGS